MLTVGSLFAGIGGFDLGLERAGMRSVWQCEIDPYCQRVLEKHWPDVLRVPDIRNVGRDTVPYVDVICGGFPCQDLSYAGKGAGLAGERSGLWTEYARVIRELQPRYVVVENVSALLARGLGVVLGDLASLGYDAEWDCIPASAVGAPHQRDRIWLVAYPRSEQHQGGSHEERWQATQGLHAADSHPDRRGFEVGGEPDGGAIGPELEAPLRGDADGLREVVADTARLPERRVRPEAGTIRQRARAGSESGRTGAMGDPNGMARSPGGTCEGRSGQVDEPGAVERAFGSGGALGEFWLTEPDVGRVADGVPARVDRLRALGNALVPQIAELIGRRIVEWEEAMTEVAA